VTPVAFVLKGYPRLSETFIAQEILALERRGLDIRIISLRYPTDPDAHPVHQDIGAPVSYLPEYLHDEPPRVLAAWWHVRSLSGYGKAWKVWMTDLQRDFSRNRIRRFGQACVLAYELPQDVQHLHAHFLHTPASVTRYAAMIRNLPWSCSAHAKDIYTSPDWEIREKLSDCRWLVTCTQANATHLKLLAPDPSVVTCAYHGLDLARFPTTPTSRELRDGKTKYSPVRLLSIGRAVEKKGYDGLLDALAALPRDIHWRFTHLGGGPELAQLQKKAISLNLSDRIDWLGPWSQKRVLEEYRQADIFVLNSRIADDGDRDGLPNVLMEAQSQGLACVASAVSAIPELIIDEKTGYLTPPDDPTAMAKLLEHVIRNPADRAKTAANGERRVRTEFALNNTIRTLAQQFDLAAHPTDNNSPNGDI
jgi:glycosyltransferase involved in cell wall biosynthesis